jgi:thiol-disulfide isomerase/thioredoxin
MKHLLLTAGILYTGGLMAQNRRIDFEQPSLTAAFVKARQENKLIFVDCATSWCGPCKEMAAHVFTQDSVADFFNTHFVNVQLDMEKGEGIQATKDYNVGAFPTFMLLNSDKQLVYRFVGSMPSDSFLAKVRRGMDPGNDVATTNALYDAGNRALPTLRAYIKIKLEGMETKEGIHVADTLFDILTPAEKLQPENWFLFGENRYSMYISDIHSRTFMYLADHWQNFTKVQGQQVVDSKLSNMFRKIACYSVRGWYYKTSRTEAHAFDKKEFERYRAQLKKTKLADKEDLIHMMEIAQAAGEKDTTKTSALMAKFIGGFSAENQGIAFDYLSMFHSSAARKSPDVQAVVDAIINSNKQPNLVRLVKDYKN